MRTNADPAHETPVSQRVVEKVAEATNTAPTDLEPLFGRIDPDALDRLFSDGSDSTVRAQGKVTFPLSGCEVTVRADGSVAVERQGVHHTFGADHIENSTAPAESPD